MLCPTILSFPSTCGTTQRVTNTWREPPKTAPAPFVRRVTLVLPGVLHPPASIKEAITGQDVDVFDAANDLKPELLATQLFVRAFVAAGEVTLYSGGGTVNPGQDDGTDNQVFLSPAGILTVITSDGGQQRHALKDLSQADRERLHDHLSRLDFPQPFYFSWTPHDPQVCPSSLAKFFHDQGSIVQERAATETLTRATFPQSACPWDAKEVDAESVMELDDWLGAKLLGFDLEELPENEDATKVLILEFTGLMSRKSLQRCCQSIQESGNKAAMFMSKFGADSTVNCSSSATDIYVYKGDQQWTSVLSRVKSGKKKYK